MHALIIEDQSLIALSIETVLRKCGFTSFDVAPSAHCAIVAAAFHRPDLITSEVQLHLGCGISAVENICDGPAIPTVSLPGMPKTLGDGCPLIACSTNPSQRPG